MNKLVKLTGLTLGLVLGLTSCTKEDSLEGSSLTTTVETVDLFANGINQLNVTQSNNTSSRNALQTVVVTINGQEQTLELDRDNYYDDNTDNLVHLSQEYRIDLVAEQTITTTLDDSTGNIIETVEDVENTFIVYFNILIDTNTNEIYTDTTSDIRVRNLHQDYIFTIELQSNNFTINLPSVSYSDSVTNLNLNL